jgi:hypothetical protein
MATQRLLLSKNLHPGGLPLFFTSYATIIWLARRRVKRRYTARYTFYVHVYCIILWMLSARQGRRSFWFAHHSAIGVLLGIQWVWYIDNYQALWEIGHRKFHSKYAIVAADAFLHGWPVLLVYLYYWRQLRPLKAPLRNPYGSGFATAAMHVLYCWLLRGDFDPAPLYRLSARPLAVVRSGWIGVVASHVAAEWLLRALMSTRRE